MEYIALTEEQKSWLKKLNNLNSIATSLESISLSLELLSGRKSITDIEINNIKNSENGNQIIKEADVLRQFRKRISEQASESTEQV